MAINPLFGFNPANKSDLAIARVLAMDTAQFAVFAVAISAVEKGTATPEQAKLIRLICSEEEPDGA